jgi:glutathione-regulated potassium-efflux system ancillary protein KefG
MKNILILFAHPALQKSRINKKLIERIQQDEGVTFHDLYQHYPEFDIDRKAEQDLLEAHDIIVFQHPFYWYSTPAILKEWQDLVLEHGWAYGREGNALKGKVLFNVITTGGNQEAYSVEGYNRYTMKMLLAPLERTAKLCKMIYLPPFVIHGTHAITPDEVFTKREQLTLLLKQLHKEKIDLSKAENLSYLNDYPIEE